MTTNRLLFCKSTIQNLPLPNLGKRSYYYDTKVEGLGLSVTDTGGKTFIVYRWLKGKPERITLGKFHPEANQHDEFERNPLSVLGIKQLRLDVDQARRLARAVVAELSAGRHPLDQKQQRSARLTFDKLFEEYIDKHAKPNTKTWQETEYSFRRHFKDWVGKDVLSITQEDIQLWVDELGKTKGKHAANRNYDIFRAVFTWGIRKKRVVDKQNPCIGVDRFKMKARERFVLPGGEFDRLAQAINREDELMC